MPERTSPEIARLAARGLRDPASFTNADIRKVCASALTQAPDRKPLLSRLKSMVMGEPS